MKEEQLSSNLCRSCRKGTIFNQTRQICRSCYNLWYKSPEAQWQWLVNSSRRYLAPSRGSFVTFQDLVDDCNGDATSRLIHEADWKAAVEAMNERLRGMSDDDIVALAEIKRFLDAVNKLERLARSASVEGIPKRPNFMTAASIPMSAEGQAHFVRQVDGRFHAINDRLLKAEKVDGVPALENQRARNIGRIAHAAYEQSKPLFGQLSSGRTHGHCQNLVLEALGRRHYNSEPRDWLEGR